MRWELKQKKKHLKKPQIKSLNPRGARIKDSQMQKECRERGEAGGSQTRRRAKAEKKLSAETTTDSQKSLTRVAQNRSVKSTETRVERNVQR